MHSLVERHRLPRKIVIRNRMDGKSDPKSTESDSDKVLRGFQESMFTVNEMSAMSKGRLPIYVI